MASDTTVAVGPNGASDYRKLTVDPQGKLRSIVDLYPGGAGEPAAPLTGTAIPGDKVAADVLIQNVDPLRVNVVESLGETTSVYSEIDGVAISAEEDVLQYTVPEGQTLHLSFITCESDSLSVIWVRQNGITIGKDRISFGGTFSVRFDFHKGDGQGLEITGGDTLTVVARNASASGPAEFSARLVGYLV